MKTSTIYQSNLSFGPVRYDTTNLHHFLRDYFSKTLEVNKLFEYNCAEAPHMLFGAHSDGISIHMQTERRYIGEDGMPSYGYVDITLMSDKTPTSDLEARLNAACETFKRKPRLIQVWS